MKEIFMVLVITMLAGIWLEVMQTAIWQEQQTMSLIDIAHSLEEINN